MTKRETKTIQLWPSGRSVEYYGDYNDDSREGAPARKLTGPNARGLRYTVTRTGTFEPGTAEEWKEIRICERARMYADQDIWHCDSSLVDDLIKAANALEGFDFESIENLYTDPSDFDAEQCREYAQDNGIELDPDPWTMDRAACVEALTDIGLDTNDDETIETLRAAVIANIDDETIDGIKDWREACRDHAQENPAEVYEWWRIDPWLCERLREIGQVVIDNDYGEWWGRCTTGQALIMDGVLQRVARGQEG